MPVNLNLTEKAVSKVVVNKPQNANKPKRSLKNIFKREKKAKSQTSNITTTLSSVPPKKRKPFNKKKALKITLFAILVIIIGVFGVLYYKADQFFRTTGLNVTPLETILFILGKKSDLTGSGETNPESNEPKPELKRDESGKYTNVLIVGVDSRQDRDSANTDTLLVASYNYETNNVNMYSLPRDLMVEIPGYNSYGKINSVYIYSELVQKDSGMTNLQTSVEGILNLKIQYYVMIDFAGFTKVIDILGGITVNVENEFTDCQYPWEGQPKNTSLMGTECYSQGAYASGGSLATYEPIKFNKGIQTMDGTTALKYARSRHSMDNMEGSDFARAKRQQKVIEAVKNKVLSSETLTSPQKIVDIIGAIQDNVRFSGYTIKDIEAGLNMLSAAKEAPINSFVLDPSIGGFSILREGYDYGYAITPIKGIGDYSDVHAYVAATLKKPGLYAQNPSIHMYNTGIGYQPGYDKTMSMIEEYPYVNFYYVGTANYTNEGNVVYKVDPSADVPSLQAVADIFNAKIIDKPAEIRINTYGVNIVVLMGTPPTPVAPEAEETAVSDSEIPAQD